MRNWEAIKKGERPPRASVLDGVPRSLPALLRAQRTQAKAARVGFDWPDAAGPLAKIADERQWEKYRYLFNMHIELKMIEQHLYLGAKFDKRVAYFYNAPWKRENLDSLATAETAYKAALAYWPSAKAWAEKAAGIRFMYLTDVQAWEDEAYRIAEGSLDYGRVIERELERLAKVRAAFEAMDEAGY
ncbi:MAG TPA: hypothetical protein PLE25_12285 [Spirochaetales bacterium]|nr:hypothetical protein [Spirochaetales bacterium]